MLLKVGELARRTGLTVRTLHHYDAMGLLTPSARSDAGYRLYDRDDIGRLHAIQALRQIGIPLAEVSTLLSGAGEPLPAIIQRQLVALDRQIARASELRTHLTLLQSRLADGTEPDMTSWMSALELMSTYGKYFSADEIKIILENWKRTAAEWPPLIAKIRSAMARGIPPESLEIQPLARHWMDLTHLWMGGDFDLICRWQKMYAQEPATQGRNGVDLEMSQYIGKAADLRLAALRKYFTADELRGFNVGLEKEWHLLADGITQLLQDKVAPDSDEAQAMVRRWSSLLDQTVNHQPQMREKLLLAFGTDPLLRAGSMLGPDQQSFIRNAWAAGATSRTSAAVV